MRRLGAVIPCVVLACATTHDAPPPRHGPLDLDDCDPAKGTLCDGPAASSASSASSSEGAATLPAPQPPMCARLSGAGIVGSGGATSPVASTEAECKSCNGSWGPHGMTGIVGCLCGTPDGGRPCSSPRDCASECLVMEPDAQQLVPRCAILGAKVPGICSYSYVVFGCHAYVVEKSTPAGPVRQVWSVCRD